MALARRAAEDRSAADRRVDRAGRQAILLAPRRRSDRDGSRRVVRRDPRAPHLGRLDALDAAGAALRATCARTLPSKLADMFRAVQLDLRLSKREILEEYLSRTPYGDNVEGVESAAWSYFGHGPQHLTPLEIATLLAVPQGPVHFAPSAANAQRLRARRDSILAKLIDGGVFSPVDAAQAIAQRAKRKPVPDHLRSMPREAAHAAIYLHARHPDELRVRSTLDAGAQAIAEQQIELRTIELHAKNIYSAALVVVDHRTREVVALVENLDFADAVHGGQLAIVPHGRGSPGSTLKPLLYALAHRSRARVAGVSRRRRTRTVRHVSPAQLRRRLRGARHAARSAVAIAELAVCRSAATARRRDVHGRARTRRRRERARCAAGHVRVVADRRRHRADPLELAGIYDALAENGVYEPLRLDGGAIR